MCVLVWWSSNGEILEVLVVDAFVMRVEVSVDVDGLVLMGFGGLSFSCLSYYWLSLFKGVVVLCNLGLGRGCRRDCFLGFVLSASMVYVYHSCFIGYF